MEGPLAGAATIITLREDVFLISSLPSPALTRPSTSQMEARGQRLTLQLQVGPFANHMRGTRFLGPRAPFLSVLSGMGGLSHCRGSGTALSTLQFVQLSILLMPLGHKMKTKKRPFWRKDTKGQDCGLFISKPALYRYSEGCHKRKEKSGEKTLHPEVTS